MTFECSPADGLGPQEGVARQDPSDIIKVGGLFYVWYLRNDTSQNDTAAIWYATSADGHTWVEKDKVLARGPAGSWDAGNILNPNILVAENRYWLFYWGISTRPVRRWSMIPENAIGLAVTDTPDGPWKKVASNPVLRPHNPLLRCFGNVQTMNPCPIIHDGKYWLYYERRQSGALSASVSLDLTIATHPEGPYPDRGVRWRAISGSTLMVWPLVPGIAAGIKSGISDTSGTLQYSIDGRRFSRMQNLEEIPIAAGAYRPEAFTDSGKGKMIDWGLRAHFPKNGLPFIERFDCQWHQISSPRAN